MKKELIKAVVLAARKPNAHLMKWVAQFDYEVVSPPSGEPQLIAATRNRICRDFLNGDKKYLLMLDDDAWPIKETEGIVTSGLPVCGCMAVSRGGGIAHHQRHEVGAHCLRVSRSALEIMRDSDGFDHHKGWFAFQFSDCGADITMCEDGYFCQLADSCGFRPVKVGLIGHVLPMVVVPSFDGMRADFPERMRDA
jgi:hypothetical protein